MDYNRVFCRLLGFQGLTIQDMKFYESEPIPRLVVIAQLPLRASCCRSCGSPFYEVHQWHKKTIRVPPLSFYQKVTLELRYPRGICSLCLKVEPARIDGLHPKFKGLSCSFVELSGRMMEDATCAAAARWFSCSPSLLWKVDQWRMDYLKRNGYEVPKDLDLSFMSADEVHFLTYRNKRRSSPFAPRWAPEFLTNLVCTRHSKVVSNAWGRDGASLKACLKALSPEQRESIEFFAIDMNPGFFSTVKRLCPKARICVDRFHLVQLMNKYIDKVRSQEYQRAKRSRDAFQMTMLGPSRRYLIAENRNRKEASREEEGMLGKLKTLNDNIHNAILITDYFHKILDSKGLKKFRESLTKWYGVVRESGSKIFREFALKVRKYRRNIEAYIQSNLTTAVSEGLNTKIKTLKRAGYAYTNKKSWENKVLQRCGFLNSKYIKTNHLFWHVPTPQI